MENVQNIKQRFGIYGKSEKLHQALETAIRVAGTDLTVLITGESGSGKEVFSKVIHHLSPRKHNQFIAVNCGAIPAGTINSELFGHEKGSFTGASSDRKGYFETVDGGTIFLDEIGEMPQDTQSFLLRILESGEFIRVGSSKVLKTNVRVIAATNVNLLEKVKRGKFREDLYYRLNTVPIKVPSLKERREDILILFRKFAQDFAEKYRTSPIELDDESAAMIESYSWPGNIRELRNSVEQLSVLSDRKLITPNDLRRIVLDINQTNLPALGPDPVNEQSGFYEREILYKLLFDMKQDLNQLKNMFVSLVQANDLTMPQSVEQDFNLMHTPVYPAGHVGSAWPKSGHEVPAVEKPVIFTNGKEEYDAVEVVEEHFSLHDMEKEMIVKALKKFNGKRKEASDELGISERTLYRKIKQFNIDI
ncbi:MAG: sigma-54-dependent Fis family transcriptional regulator [Saprospiraceae bacterium]|nr:sigma-54-dependent Fis family transcriptional regulator [Saprospiraceae bacterium]